MVIMVLELVLVMVVIGDGGSGGDGGDRVHYKAGDDQMGQVPGIVG